LTTLIVLLYCDDRTNGKRRPVVTNQLPLATEDQRRLDELVPRPWPLRRRLVALAVALAAVAGLLAVVLSGALGPRLSHGNGWGSGVTRLDGQQRITVERLTPIHNDGWPR
jgi:hypothetical protein